MFGRVAAVLAPLVTFLVTFLVAWPLMLTPALGQSAPPTQVVRRELRIGAPGVPPRSIRARPWRARARSSRARSSTPSWPGAREHRDRAGAGHAWNVSRDGLVWSSPCAKVLNSTTVAADRTGGRRELRASATSGGSGCEQDVAGAAARHARSREGGPRAQCADGRDHSGPALRSAADGPRPSRARRCEALTGRGRARAPDRHGTLSHRRCLGRASRARGHARILGGRAEVRAARVSST